MFVVVFKKSSDYFKAFPQTAAFARISSCRRSRGKPETSTVKQKKLPQLQFQDQNPHAATQESKRSTSSRLTFIKTAHVQRFNPRLWSLILWSCQTLCDSVGREVKDGGSTSINYFQYFQYCRIWSYNKLWVLCPFVHSELTFTTFTMEIL